MFVLLGCGDDVTMPAGRTTEAHDPRAVGDAGDGAAVLPNVGAFGPGGSNAMLPEDDRAPVVAAAAPPMISGGTLLVLRDGVTAIAADPDRDRVSIVGLGPEGLLGHVLLEPGDEPGRATQDAAGRVHVVLRGGGAVASIDVPSRKVTERRSVCGAPRGIAYDASADVLHVACLGGELLTLPADGGQPLRNVRVATDLRDVIVQDGRLLVTQFKSAALLEIDADGVAMTRRRPLSVTQTGNSEATEDPRRLEPALARRAIAMGDGRTLVLHQRALAETIDLSPPPQEQQVVGSGPYGGSTGSVAAPIPGCRSIVQTALTVIDEDGRVQQSASVGEAVLAVDVAISPDETTLVIASAGGRDPGAPAPGAAPLPAGTEPAPQGTVSMIAMNDALFQQGDEIGEGCLRSPMFVPGQPTAVAFASDGTLVVQSREPARLILMFSGGMRMIELGGESRLDTGHELFHRDPGVGIACASCHGEGGDDGHTWKFSRIGRRRTQAVNIGLAGTEPFHWSGEMEDLNTLMNEVFVGRMGAAPQSERRLNALSSWIFQQRPPAPLRNPQDEAALRGKALFESTEVGCTACHSGEKLTNNDNVDVGTGLALQVPSLIGIGHRAPFMHTGCAATLHDRFDPNCGGDQHGQTAQLDPAQIDDLVAYLESL